MPRVREDYTLQKVTLNLYEGEFARLQNLFPRQGAGKILRDLLHAYLTRLEKRIADNHPTDNIPIEEL